MHTELLENRKLLAAYTLVSSEVGYSQESVITADWNHDGKIGVAFSNYANHIVKVGYKAFGGRINTGTQYNYITIPFDYGIEQLSTADLNGDYLPDIVASSFDKGSFAVYLNQGNSKFTFSKWYDVPGVNSVALGDFDRDGQVDLVCGKSYQTGLTTFFGIGNGKFTSSVTLPTTSQLNAVAIGDVVGGNGRDIVAVDYKANKMLIYRYDGGTTFTQYGSYDTGSGPADVLVGDIIGDTALDIVTANYIGDSISVFDGNQLPSPLINSTGIKSSPTGLSLVDYDGDGDKDLAVVCAQNDTLIKFNHNLNQLSLASITNLARSSNVSWNPSAVDAPLPRRVVPVFYDTDNKEDLFIANEGTNYFTVSYYSNLVRLGPLIKSDIIKLFSDYLL